MSGNDPASPIFSEDEVRRILRRAAELEAAGGGVSLSDLVDSAAEAGLQPDLVREAAAEVVAARDADPAQQFRSGGRPVSTANAALAGVSLGILTGVLEITIQPDSIVDVPSFATLVALGWFICERQRGSRDSPLTKLASLLIGFGLGWVLINVDVSGDLALAMLSAGVLSLSLAQLRRVRAKLTRRA